MCVCVCALRAHVPKEVYPTSVKDIVFLFSCNTNLQEISLIVIINLQQLSVVRVLPAQQIVGP